MFCDFLRPRFLGDCFGRFEREAGGGAGEEGGGALNAIGGVEAGLPVSPWDKCLITVGRLEWSVVWKECLEGDVAGEWLTLVVINVRFALDV